MAAFAPYRRRFDNHPVAPSNQNDRGFSSRWGSEAIFREGFLGVPATFLKHYNALNITANEAMFILQLMSFKWSDRAPFPSYEKLAKRMGVTKEMVRCYAQRLEQKSLVLRIKRTGCSNAFDLQPLTAALEKIMATEAKAVAA